MSTAAFMDEAGAPREVLDIVHGALTSGRGLRFEVDYREVRVDSTDETHLQSVGSWTSTHLADTVGYRPLRSVVAPLFFGATAIVLPFKALTTLKIGERPLANTVMRNLFNAGVRREPVEFIETKGAPSNTARALIKRYLWIVKHELPCATFEGPYLADRLLIETHLSSMPIERPVLRRAFSELRGELDDAEDRTLQFLVGRKTMLEVS